jgi:uncharacterized protein YfaT (DUF1175 family)
MTALVLLVLAGSPGAPSVELLRQVTAETAIAQVKTIDGRWHPDQRDCAGLVRFSMRQAYKRIAPKRLETPLFTSSAGPTDFADAETLVRGGSFALLGKDEAARRRLQTADVLVYRQDRGDDDVAWHMMLAIVPPSSEARVVYHPGHAEPGEPPAQVRHGLLRALEREAPQSWRADVDNPAFLGFFRFAEFAS